jgi:hypothetical protein
MIARDDRRAVTIYRKIYEYGILTQGVDAPRSIRGRA